MNCRPLLLVLFLLLFASIRTTLAEETTPALFPPERYSLWMTEPDLGEFGKWFNKAGFWPIRVEGRVKDQKEQFRVVIERMPLSGKFGYLWWFNMDEEFYRARHTQLADEGFSEISYQTFKTESGETRHQAIWRKIEKP